MDKMPFLVDKMILEAISSIGADGAARDFGCLLGARTGASPQRADLDPRQRTSLLGHLN